MWMEYGEGLGYLKQVREYLESGAWPSKTLKGEQYLFTANIYEKKRLGSRFYNIVLTDVAGEDFDEFCDPNKSLSEDTSGKYNHLLNSSAYLFLVDPSRASEDMWRFYRFMQLVMKQKSLGANEKIENPVAVIFTKYDQHQEILTDPEKYAQDNMTDLYHMLRNRTNKLAFRAISATGTTNESGMPQTPITPTGVAEIMEWVFQQS